jgi:hypothetical protein
MRHLAVATRPILAQPQPDSQAATSDPWLQTSFQQLGAILSKLSAPSQTVLRHFGSEKATFNVLIQITQEN